MDVKHGNNKFYVEKDSEEMASLAYAPDGDVLTVTHTEVSPELSGQGVGKQLVSEVVQYARNEGKTIDAQCSFARGVIEKTPEFQDVLKN
ncbi:GNAT family N-acetyltransferase [Planococcus halotolerans]|uniref:GNAT family N-acetyltransferase n=1 Tax=Planococcus halotolerans TaxID=2233542 RepID=A0A365KQF7_9BACL|nr:GNAT family N-acetyltransferase [Planococcus halotolerans]QHJ69439.1 GNAT family N-acetyltransferase [Planococcus halotolerans]RAZ75391.1 GNAT family N-acetyltransferase [Planococcus halotolerans]